MPKKLPSPNMPVSPSGCPMDSFLRLLMGQWTCYILWILRTQGPMRFGVLKRSIPGLSSKVLTERLRMLEGAQIIYRDHVATIPPQVTYGLSDRGRELVTALDELFAIAKRWFEEDYPNGVCPNEASDEIPDSAAVVIEGLDTLAADITSITSQPSPNDAEPSGAIPG